MILKAILPFHNNVEMLPTIGENIRPQTLGHRNITSFEINSCFNLLGPNPDATLFLHLSLALCLL